ncbi:MAG TPA: hypothetical protein PL151_14080 [Phycisphaerae bacterium]|nr:hypothetical protein [Phycisphaerae bacterium]HOJ73487.1 hypothetical protein [Phycisphaerae bacterium]HOM51096.1 hypothetical protein [Phycisphaerae bacterium]HON66760.1 hypothetical protein [Phycisphaerae bacterium]HOQ85281.1 hypothetical protein [Phycisphaerae bacterium]
MFGTNNDTFMNEMLEQTQTLTKLWMDTASRMTGAMFAFTPGATPFEANRQVRDAFLSSWGHSLEAYMRSEPFLRSMRQSLDLAMEMRKQFSQLMTQVHHSTGTAAQEDIRSIMLALRHAEVRLSQRMEQLMDRLEQLEGQLDEIQDSVELIKGDVEVVEAELGSDEENNRMSRGPRTASHARKRTSSRNRKAT